MHSWTCKNAKDKKFRDLSEIDPYATCISLEIPQMFSCSVCYDKYKNVLAHTRKKRKEERCKSSTINVNNYGIMQI